jgi:multiple sugar transport system substrate-binding protein
MARPHFTRRGTLALAALAGAAALVLSGCSSQGNSSSSKPDNGTALTMWARHTDGDLPKLLVDAYNKTHKNQVKLTIIPADTYQQKVGAAAGSNGLPDILASDVVYSPNYVKQGLFQDITSDVKGLSFYNDLAKAHSEAASKDGKIYGVPLVVDSSLIIYNKDLFKQAGLDPATGPKNFDEIYTDAKAIRDKVGGDVYGFYWAGNCAGCNAYTLFPYAAAAGDAPFQKDGTKADFDSKAMNSTLALYKKLTDEGIAPAGVKTEDGTNWAQSFNAGKVGILPIGSFDFGALKDAKFDWGVAELPAPDGSKTSTFVGGDVVGVSKNSKHAAQAWDFLKWVLGDDAQVNVIAKSGNLPSRVDLANNKYSGKDPRIVQTIKGLAYGYTPSTTQYGALINDGTGPWLKGIRDYVFAGQSDALATAQKTIQSGLDQAK